MVAADNDQEAGDKGQKHLRYNVNGVLLDNAGFKKLMSEIPLKKLRLKFANQTETMFVGRFPDVNGKDRDLVIREGRTGTWQDDRMVQAEAGEVFYEIIPNSRLGSQVLDAARKS